MPDRVLPRRGFADRPRRHCNRDYRKMKREDCICFSGAATGAEATFGAAAERYGIDEVNFTFEGHNPARQRGRRVLTRA